jgi:di/tricarboxylate transporter
MKKHTLVKTLIIIGCILVVSGIIFVAQSKSEIGPQSSFMYSNPQWTPNGFAISIIGLVVLACGIIIHYIKNL